MNICCLRHAAAALASLLLLGCVTLGPPPELEPSHALPPPRAGALYEHTERVLVDLAPDESAYWLLDRNESALYARLALTDEAVSSLDVQYFIWQDDAAGKLLIRRLLHAAERGVRVRLLLDDLGLGGREAELAALDAHSRIEVRVFNPWMRRSPRFAQAFEFLFRLGALNHRMHNKIYVADNHYGIVGGRNVGDRYFGVHEGFVQHDLDVLVAGPTVAELSRSFDLYWNSAHVYPGSAFGRGDERDELGRMLGRMDTALTSSPWATGALGLEPTSWASYLDELSRSFVSGPGDVYYDSPSIDDGYPEALYERFRRLIGSAEREVLISTPYFIPDRELLDELAELVARGVRVVVLTNSLASNNQTVAHTGYKQRRRAALQAGVELYELRSDAAALELYATPPVQAARLGLHTKAVVVDGRRSFMGSPNVDPRSMRWNTEIGLEVESEALAELLRALIVRDLEPENSWRVTMADDGWLTWSSSAGTLERQPARGFGQRAMEFFLNLLPIKNQL